MIDPRVIALIAAISQEHKIMISSLRSDHSMNTVSGNVSNHYFGRAVDIAAIDGVSCTRHHVDGPCGTHGPRAGARCRPARCPTELIFCFDADGPGPGLRRRRPLRPHPRRASTTELICPHEPLRSEVVDAGPRP